MMARITGVLACCILLLSACSGDKDGAGSSPDGPAGSAIEPKIVVQIGHQMPVEAAQWVDRGRHLVTLARDGSLVFWDVATGAILDHAQVPDPAAKLGSEDLSFAALRPGPDAQTLTILYHLADGYKGPVAALCPAEAQNTQRWCSYSLDLATRRVQPDNGVPTQARSEQADFPLSPDGKLRPERNHADGQRGLFSESDDNITFADQTCVSAARCRYGVNLFPVAGGGAPIRLTGNPRSYFRDADLSADGRRLVRVEGLMNDKKARVETLDLSTGTGQPVYLPAQAYHQVNWIGDQRYALFSQGYSASDDTEDAMAGFPAALLVDPACARAACPRLESHWQMQALDDQGSFIALGGLADCFRWAPFDVACPPSGDHYVDDGNETQDPYTTGLSLHQAGAPGWRTIDRPDWAGQTITAIRLSPDRQRLAVATRQWDPADKPGARQILRLWMIDGDVQSATAPARKILEIETGIAQIKAQGGTGFSDSGTIRALSFTPDGKRILLTQTMGNDPARADLHIVDVMGREPMRNIAGFSRRIFAAGNDRVLGLDTAQLLDLRSGKPVASNMGAARIVKAGRIAQSRLLWGAADDGAIQFWDEASGALQLTLYMFPDNRFFALAPGGRYDTNLGPDTRLIRWMVPDAPWQSLSSQTFMRDFYEPGLYGKILDCRAANSCGEVFRQLPSIAALNRVMPEIAITGVRPGPDASQAIVSIQVRDGVDEEAANGKTHSGVYNPRLFRNGRVVAMNPDEPDAVTDTLEKWRKLNDVGARASADGWLRYEFTVPLPTGAGTEEQLFSAYAFNEDRIKSETVSYTYRRPPVPPRKPRAFVVAIGIDDYDTQRFRLNYSVADARLIAARLEDIPGYEMRRLVLAGEQTAGGQRKRVDNSTIMRVLSLLMTNQRRAEGLKALAAEDGVDASTLEEATPDDIVIVSFSGHGWADKQGNFYLIPTNGYWPEGSETPELRSLFATSQLSMYFRAINAADITLIIDACHSSASVASKGFKPGPMGDSGLGQLAYDKGIRILAATQADDVAMEDANLRQGLLTYALAAEGLTARGGRADLDGDRRIRLDEWLTYAVQRLPSLAEDRRVGQIGPAAGGARGISFHDLPDDAPKRRLQKPSLFDFNAQASPVILRRVGG